MQDQDQLRTGIEGSTKALDALEAIAIEGLQLNSHELTLADLHLAPMIAYFIEAPEGQKLFTQYPELSIWWECMQKRISLHDTDPGLKDYPAVLNSK